MHINPDFGNMHCMNTDLSDLTRLRQKLIRLGTIAGIKGARARVRLGPNTHHGLAEIGYTARR